jgi:type II secretory pathway component PulF
MATVLQEKPNTPGLIPEPRRSGPEAPAAVPRSRWATWRLRRWVPVVTRQLAIMLKAGVDVASALEAIVRQAGQGELKRVFQEVHRDVSSGCTFSFALRRWPTVFPQHLVASVAAGEASGRLPQVLEKAAEAAEQERKLRSSLANMLAYPAILLVLSLAVLAAMLGFVLPQFEQIFQEAGVPLPTVTQWLLGLSSWLTSHPLLCLGLVATAVAGAVTGLRLPAAARTVPRWLLHVPVVGRISRDLNLGRFLQGTGVLLENGVPLLEALELAAQSVRHPEFRALAQTLINHVLEGRGLAGTLRVSQLVPPATAEMVATAERTGTLAWVMQFVGNYHLEEAETRLRTLVRLVEPLLIILLGLLVAGIVASVMLPLFDLSRVAAQG